MERKIVDRDPVTGRTRERYVDCGPGSAKPGHDRPVLASQSTRHVKDFGGRKQIRLGAGAA